MSTKRAAAAATGIHDIVPMLLLFSVDFYSFFAHFRTVQCSAFYSIIEAVLFSKYLPCEAADSILKSNNSTKIFQLYVHEHETTVSERASRERVRKSNCIISRECLFAFGRLAWLLTNACDSSACASLPSCWPLQLCIIDVISMYMLFQYELLVFIERYIWGVIMTILKRIIHGCVWTSQTDCCIVSHYSRSFFLSKLHIHESDIIELVE